MRMILTACAFLLTALSAQADCVRVHFQHGAYSAEVSGYVNYATSICYVLDVRVGQAARLRIVNAPNVAFEVPGIGKMQTDVQYYTTSPVMQVYVYQVHPTPDGQPFRLIFDIV